MYVGEHVKKESLNLKIMGFHQPNRLMAQRPLAKQQGD